MLILGIWFLLYIRKLTADSIFMMRARNHRYTYSQPCLTSVSLYNIYSGVLLEIGGTRETGELCL